MAITEYKAKTWEDSPSKATPLNAENLNGIEQGIAKLSKEVSQEFKNLPTPERGEPGPAGKDGAKGEQGAPGKDGAKGATGTAGKDFQVTNAPAPIGSIAVMQADGWKALTVEEFKAHVGIE